MTDQHPYYYPGPPGEPTPWAAPPPPPPKRKGGALVVAAVVGVALCIVGALVLGAVASNTDDPRGTFSEQRTAPATKPTTAAKQKPAPQKPKVAALPTTVGEGTFRVGKDVAPGEYRTAGAAEGVIPLCYWHTALDTSARRIVDQGVSDSTSEAGLVVLKRGQYFKTSGCQEWVKQ